jgi:hypothetical protein
LGFQCHLGSPGHLPIGGGDPPATWASLPGQLALRLLAGSPLSGSQDADSWAVTCQRLFKLDARGLRALVLELALARGAYFAWSTRYSERLTAAASAYGIDIATIEKASAEQIATRHAGRSAPKSKKGNATPAA